MPRFEKKEWSDRISEYPTRRLLTNVSTLEEQIVEVARSEGTILQEGDAFSQGNMNNLEGRIETAISRLYEMAGFVDYEETESYSVGDYVVHEDTLFKCLSETTGEWIQSAWKQTTLADAIKELGPVNNLTSTSTNAALAANQGRALNAGLNALNNNGLITGLEFDGTDFYISGKKGTAATVKKKLGSGSTISVKAVVTDFRLPTNTTYVASGLDPTKMYYITCKTRGESISSEGYLNISNCLYKDGSYVTPSNEYVPFKYNSNLTVGLGIVKNTTYVRGNNSYNTILSIYVSIYELYVE